MKNLVNKIVLVIAAISISLLSFTQQNPIKIQFLNNEGSPVSDTSDIINEYNGADGYGVDLGWSDYGQLVSISINTNIIDGISIFDAANNDSILSPTFIGIKSTTAPVDYDVYKYENYEYDTVITSKTEIVYDSIYYAAIQIQVGNTGYLYPFKIKFIADNTASVVENEISVSDVLVYPNPVINNLTVEFETINSDIPVEVYSFNGHLMFVDNDYRSFGSNKVSIDMSDYPSGMYMVRLGNEVKKVIK